VKRPAALKLARQVIRDGQIVPVVFLGHTAMGKTSLAVAMASELYRSHRTSFVFVTARDLAKAYLNHPLGHGDPPIVEACRRARLLLVDEFATEREEARTAGAASPAAELVLDRYDLDRVTWITTGASREAIAKRYGSGVERRLFEAAAVVDLDASRFDGVDLPLDRPHASTCRCRKCRPVRRAVATPPEDPPVGAPPDLLEQVQHIGAKPAHHALTSEEYEARRAEQNEAVKKMA
jgi:hypothetical protein